MAAIFHFLCVLLTAGAVVAAGSQFNLTILTTSSTAAEVTQLPSGRTYGGYATLQTALSKARVNLASTSTPTLAIHGLSALGMYSFSQYYKGKKEATYLSRLGFQYTTFGSRDLFHGTEVYANNFLNNTSVACISSNTWISKSSALSNLCQRYKVTTLTDANTQTTFKAAIVSYVVTDFCSFTFCAESASSPAQVKVLDIIPEMTAFIQQLQFQENPDVVIAMSSGLDLNGDLAIASAVPGIDVIITSDDKTVSSKSFPIAATGAEGGPVLIVADMTPEGVRGLARVDLQWRNGSLAAWSGTRDPLNSCQGDPSPLATCIPPDAAFVSDIVADYVEVDKALEVVIGSTTALLNGAQLPNHPCRRSDCTAGSVVCDSMLWVTDGQCDAAILNGGSIRDSLPAGNVTMKNIMGMLPNHNTISVTRLRGIDVLDALSSGLSKVFPQGSAGRFPQVGNIHYTYNVNNKPDALRLVSAQIFNRTQGTYVDIDPNAIYNICVNDYMLNGGDGYSMLLTNALSTFSQGTQLDVALRSYMAAQSPISPPAGQRILDLSTTSPSSPPLLGSCKFATSVTNASSILLDPCDGGSRFRTNVSWTITPTITSLRSINLSFGNFTMDPTTDVLYLYNPATNQLLQVRSPADNVSMVPANYTSLPSSVGIPNVVSVGVRFVANRPLTGSGVKLSYAAHDGCPGGYILDNGNCVGCPAGTYAGLLDVQCTACPAGSVTTTSGLETCAVCQEGTFSDAAGRTQCQTCDRGRIWISSTQCQCAAGTFFNDFTCLPIGSGSSQTGQIIGIALGLIVLGAGIGFYVYRRRMAAIKRRQMGTSKQKALKADVAMKRLVHDIVLSVMQIGMDAGECALDWYVLTSTLYWELQSPGHL
ncbi:uncharacterized protein EV422DRAFT_154588 [Fimicolochytrium jonesii]|uniref:uncharacterized protein n=1 Tax=Fimicolochytrium jonesii TaxID=1396493 RepID=UPI0022FE1B4D|nr:uncharacterized protein EV422DRAFT_154588 [Fimicolochytrium jonesii]KAI8826112.1 hypothetical protein EV422DRAFT_154588 [Fimicolochytrium jonesii]